MGRARQGGAAEGKGGAKRAYVQSKAIINPPDGNIDLEINISEDEMQDMIFHNELDQQDYDRYFKKQKRILVAKQFNMNEKVHSVHFTESRSDEALIDSGCEKNCAGTVAYDKFLRTLSPEDRAQVREFEGSSQFKFGGAGIYGSLKEVLVPVYIAGSKMWLRMDIVDTDIPILVGLPVLKQLELGIQYANRGQDYGYFQSQRFKIFHRGGHHYFKISKQGSMDSLDPEASQDKVFTTFVGKVRVIDNDKVKSQLKQLHTNFAHVNKLKMIEMDIYVNQNLINKQRSDGVIIASPTGSTAYAMSNGCPIVSPQSDVTCIVPIAPHSYGQRSVIINNTDTITIKVNKKSIGNSQVTFDGANNLTIKNPNDIFIKKASRQLQIIHPCDYDYFNVLSKKLRYDIKS